MKERAAKALEDAGVVLTPAERQAIEIEPQDSYRLELENMSDAIRGRGELLLARDDAIGQARALGALHDAASKGAPVTL